MAQAKDERGLPRWQSHKEVAADKIVGVEDGSGEVLFRWRLAGGTLVDVTEDLARRVKAHTPAVGGWYISYSDGHESWSPAETFEGGYTAIEEGIG